MFLSPRAQDEPSCVGERKAWDSKKWPEFQHVLY